MENNFITDIINLDIESKKYDKKVNTRFPPEPNGYLHIGHAKSICLNFNLAEFYNGNCNLRFDDTNPAKEEKEYVDAIIKDVKWLGFDVENKVKYASDYFQQMFNYAIDLIKLGKAYVDDSSPDEIKKNRGTLTDPGIDSQYRNRTIKENLDLFIRMKNGDYLDGEKVLRAKIDMTSPNINLRDPILYRIQHTNHHRTSDKWCVYPMYDWAHGLEDSIEKITHSICTLEFEDHRPLYNWFLNQLNIHHPQQIEFARLNVSYTVLSKRKLKMLVENNYVSGWDDPRMPTLSGLRRRGYSPESIKSFVYKTGIVKRNGISDIALLEHSIREDLNKKSQRVMVVIDPVKLIIENYPDDKIEKLEAENNPEKESDGRRMIPFSKEIWIERSDFMEEPSKKFYRMSIGNEVRLKHAYYVKCTSFIKDEKGQIKEIYCTYDKNTRGGWSDDGRKVRGTIHWVSDFDFCDAEIRVYDRLFNVENPEKVCKNNEDFTSNMNSDSLKILNKCKLEPSLKNAKKNTYYQFIRNGYFILDKSSKKNKLIFNRTITLRDSFKK